MTSATTTAPRAAALAALANLADRAAELGRLIEGTGVPAADLAEVLAEVLAVAEAARLALEAARGLVPVECGAGEGVSP
jgi:hypothetical protein